MINSKIIIFILSLGFSLNVLSQLKSNTEFNKDRLRINKTGMLVLSSWAAANITIGSIGWATTEGESQYFHQMNVFWNIVNLGIAVPGLFTSNATNAKKVSPGELINKQYSTEQIYLINNGLNMLYIGSGALLQSITEKNQKNYSRFKGYGNALLLQGGFLLIFDTFQYLRHRNHRKNAKHLFFDQLSLSNSGVGLKYTFN
ncbi:DUF6992 family protein [Brumimicrobium oceani]|uniref:Uncharacterized protein n=1 Tax=Brumimicrobium oceani TaxID=2100725 RepID=A0A2U2XA75_9FLAO|nr:hypothetical protein [Brumimicrobium oceani]PWH84657.1 hypothetical protein DIT68_13100 [Brumimicrobium oceani]